MKLEDYRSKASELYPDLNGDELDSLISPVLKKGGLTAYFAKKDLLFEKQALFSLTRPQTEKWKVQSIADAWRGDDARPAEYQDAFELWLKINRLAKQSDTSKSETSTNDFRTYLAKERRINEKYVKEHIQKLGASGKLNILAGDCGLVPEGCESLLDTDDAQIKNVSEWWYNEGEASDALAPRDRTIMQNYLEFRGTAKKEQNKRERLSYSKITKPQHMFRFRLILQIINSIVTGGAERFISVVASEYDEKGRIKKKKENYDSALLDEDSTAFRSFHKTVLKNLKNNYDRVKDGLSEKFDGGTLRDISNRLIEQLLSDNKYIKSFIGFFSSFRVPYQNSLLDNIDKLYRETKKPQADDSALADAFLSVIHSALLDCCGIHPLESIEVLPGDALREAAFRNNRMIRERLNKSRIDEDTLKILADIPVPPDEDDTELIAACVFHSMLFYIDLYMGRGEKAGGIVWNDIGCQGADAAAGGDPDKAMFWLKAVIDYTRTNPETLERALAAHRSEWYTRCRGSLLLGGMDECVLLMQLYLRMLELLTAGLNTSDIYGSAQEEKTGLSLMKAKEYIRRCEKISEHRRADGQITAEINEDAGSGDILVIYPALIRVCLYKAKVEYHLSLMEKEEIWLRDIIALYMHPCYMALESAGLCLKTLMSSELMPYVSGKTAGLFERALKDAYTEYYRQFFLDADSAVCSRMKAYKNDDEALYRRERELWRSAFDLGDIEENTPGVSGFALRTDKDAELVQSADSVKEVYMSALDSVSGRDEKHQEDVELALFQQVASGKTILLQMNQICDNRAMLRMLKEPGFRLLCRKGIIALSCYREIDDPETYLLNNLQNRAFIFSSSESYALSRNCSDIEYSLSCRSQMIKCITDRHFYSGAFSDDDLEEMEFLFDSYMMLFECFQPSDLRRFHQNLERRWPMSVSKPQIISLDEVLKQRLERISGKLRITKPELAEAFEDYYNKWNKYTDRSHYDADIEAAISSAETMQEVDFLEKFRRLVYQSYYISNGKRSCPTILLSENDPDLFLKDDYADERRHSVATKYILGQIKRPGGKVDITWDDIYERALESRRIEELDRKLSMDQITAQKTRSLGLEHMMVNNEDIIVSKLTPKTSQGICKTVSQASKNDVSTEEIEVIE